MTNILNTAQEKINTICQDAGITYLALFGSQARGDASDSSDVDLLVEFKETPGLISFIRTKQQFEAVFKKKVDLITKGLVKLKRIFPQSFKDFLVHTFSVVPTEFRLLQV